MNRYARPAALMCCCAAMACDTQGGRGESTTYLHTDPGAVCELRGQNYVRTVNTPNSVRLPHGAAPISVACTSEGYAEATTTLDTAMDTRLLGALLLGGMFGTTADGSRGVGTAYPARVMLVLAPLEFPSAAERDAWFDRRKAALQARWAAALAEMQGGATCKNALRAEFCRVELRKMEQQRDAELKELEARRGRATVAGS